MPLSFSEGVGADVIIDTIDVFAALQKDDDAFTTDRVSAFEGSGDSLSYRASESDGQSRARTNLRGSSLSSGYRLQSSSEGRVELTGTGISTSQGGSNVVFDITTPHTYTIRGAYSVGPDGNSPRQPAYSGTGNFGNGLAAVGSAGSLSPFYQESDGANFDQERVRRRSLRLTANERGDGDGAAASIPTFGDTRGTLEPGRYFFTTNSFTGTFGFEEADEPLEWNSAATLRLTEVPRDEDAPGVSELYLGNPTNDFDADLPTIVYSHGWQPFRPSSDFGLGDVPGRDVVDSILSRLDEEKAEANVLFFSWKDAFTGGDLSLGAKDSYRGVANAGSSLGSQLAKILDGEQSLHLIGHSHGSGVNGFAADVLGNAGLDVDLFTILDAPMDVTSSIYTGADFPTDFFSAQLDQDTVSYVENFYSRLPLLPDAGFGKKIDGANNDAEAESHFTIDDNAYGKDIVERNRSEWRTPFRDNLDALTEWRNQDLSITNANFKDWVSIFGTSRDEACAKYTRSWRGRGSACNVSAAYRSLIESSPSSIFTDILIPNNANVFAFDYVFGDVGDGDWISLFFEDQLIWELSGQSMLEGLVGTAFIDVQELRGLDGALTFMLNSVGVSNMDFGFANLRFLEDQVAVSAPTTLSLSLHLASQVLAGGGARKPKQNS